MAKTTIHETNMAKYFWTEVVNTSCYVKNRRPITSYFHEFGCTCYILL